MGQIVKINLFTIGKQIYIVTKGLNLKNLWFDTLIPMSKGQPMNLISLPSNYNLGMEEASVSIA